jgi:hypothetical protein
VPIGPAARARAAQRDLDGAMPPAADAFWSEDSAALHDAVQAPPGVSRTHLKPPTGLVPPVAGLRVPGLGRLPRLTSLPAGGRVSRWWGLAALASAAVLAVAVIGSAEGPTSNPRAGNSSASHSVVAAHASSSSPAISADAARAKFNSQVTTPHHRAPGQHARGHARARAHPARAAHHRTAVHHSAPSSASTVTQEASATPPPQTTEQSSPPTTSTTPATSTASTVASAGSKPARTPAGPTQLGRISGGCTPKCP